MEEIIQEHIDKLLLFMREEAYKPLTIQELEEAFGIEGSEGFKDFVKALVTMEEKGLVIRTRSNRYGLPEKMNLIRGKLIGHARGFAFVVPDEKKTGDDDLFIPPTELNGALHGDTVLARLRLPIKWFASRRFHCTHFRTRNERVSWYIYRIEKLWICYT